MKKLQSVPEVIAALGGRKAIAELVGVSVKAVAIWRWQGVFPAKAYIVIRDALRLRDFEPHVSLFSFITIEDRDNAA